MLFIAWLHENIPSPILLTIGPIPIYWYGFLYLVAIVLGYLLVRHQLSSAKEEDKVNAEKLALALPDVAFGTIVSGLVGARLYHVINELPYYLERPLEIIAVWHGGLAIHGGILGGALFLWWYARRSNVPLLWLTDLIAPALLLGQAIGRWGNYFNQELYGKLTDLPWGIPITSNTLHLASLGIDIEQAYYHPTFLYESAWSFLGLIALAILWRTIRRLPLGATTGAYLVWTSIGRLAVETLRIDPTPLILGVRLPMIVACGGVLLGGWMLVTTIRKKRDVY